ncbi:MAG: DNA topoisomerase [Bacteroides sp.]|nr:DNA topoisomerase [Prevotella sp.]MCM1407018.1 DNA topoisomerase [Treponema brennaborense]MCM1470169.1 DNA topoisomerase [Bacteroides sp.]
MLILTEKPAVAKDFANVLGCQFHSGYYSDGKTDITNCVGHLFRLEEPCFYDERFKSWKELPCIPEKFSYAVNDTVKAQASGVTSLLRRHRYDTILIATDADREGEIIARECLEQSGIIDFSRVKRFWVSQALTPEVIREGIKNAKPLSEYDKLAEKGFARQHSDWLTGYNFTRYISIAAKKKLSIGRVKTAILSAIDARCSQIQNFKAEKYYEFFGSFGAQRCAPVCKGIFFVPENKTQFSNNALETELKADVSKAANVVENKTEKKEIPAPQLYNLNAVQKDAFKLYGFSAEETLFVIQRLYEEYKCVSYPRTPSKVMGSGNVALVNKIFGDLAKTYPDFNEALKISDISLNNKRCFNDAKLEAHHALIPLKTLPSDAGEKETQIYSLILNRFKVAFASTFVYNRQSVVLSVNGHTYKITGTQTLDLGWKRFSSATSRSAEEQSLENIDWNNLCLLEAETKEKWTKPPKYFNEASILAFMENPKSEDENGKLLGLGTQATRHTFIPELKANGYIKVEGKILITQLGKTVIEAVRNSSIKSFADIAQTTDWEKRLEENPELFESEIKTFIKTAVKVPFEIEVPPDENQVLCPRCKQPLKYGTTKSGYKHWFCTGYKNSCGFTIWENFCDSKLSERDVALLCSGKKTPLKRLHSKKTGKDFTARLYLDSNSQIKMEFGH